MTLTALIMAGGRATRMNSAEKAVLSVEGKAIIQRISDALKHSECVKRIVVATTQRSPQTTRVARGLGMEVIETPGDGFEPDMRYAIKKLALGHVLIVSADLPFLTGNFVDEVYGRYRACGKPSLAVMCPVEVYREIGCKPSHVFEVEGTELAPVGINILDGTKINEHRLEEELFVTRSKTLAINVNTPEDLETARKYSNSVKARGIGKPVKSQHVARVTVFATLAVVGSFIHLPGPVQTVALDSSSGFFVALYFGPLDGGLVSGIGHLATSIINGFPLGFLHFPIAAGLAFAGVTMGLINRRAGPFVAVAMGVVINSALVVTAVPALGWAATITLFPFLLFAASLNGAIASLAYLGVRRRLGV